MCSEYTSSVGLVGMVPEECEAIEAGTCRIGERQQPRPAHTRIPPVYLRVSIVLQFALRRTVPTTTSLSGFTVWEKR